VRKGLDSRLPRLVLLDGGWSQRQACYSKPRSHFLCAVWVPTPFGPASRRSKLRRAGAAFVEGPARSSIGSDGNHDRRLASPSSTFRGSGFCDASNGAHLAGVAVDLAVALGHVSEIRTVGGQLARGLKAGNFDVA